MKIHFASDIHLEFVEIQKDFDYVVPECDVLIFPGDVGNEHQGLEFLAKQKDKSKHQIFVPGNHDYYGKEYNKHNKAMKKMAATLGVHFLFNETLVIDHVRFIGTTMWTNFDLHRNAPTAEVIVQGELADYDNIKFKDHLYRKRKIIPANVRAWNKTAVDYIAEAVATPFDGKTVIVTHHAPTKYSIEEWRRFDKLAPAYAMDLESFLHYNEGIDYWLHGHVHHSVDYMVADTRVMCNPRGYQDIVIWTKERGKEIKRELNPNFDMNLILEL